KLGQLGVVEVDPLHVPPLPNLASECYQLLDRDPRHPDRLLLFAVLSTFHPHYTVHMCTCQHLKPTFFGFFRRPIQGWRMKVPGDGESNATGYVLMAWRWGE